MSTEKYDEDGLIYPVYSVKPTSVYNWCFHFVLPVPYYNKGCLLCDESYPASLHLVVQSQQICSKLMIKTPETRHLGCSGVFNVNFEHFTHCPGVSIIDFE